MKKNIIILIILLFPIMVNSENTKLEKLLKYTEENSYEIIHTEKEEDEFFPLETYKISKDNISISITCYDNNQLAKEDFLEVYNEDKKIDIIDNEYNTNFSIEDYSAYEIKNTNEYYSNIVLLDNYLIISKGLYEDKDKINSFLKDNEISINNESNLPKEKIIILVSLIIVLTTIVILVLQRIIKK